MAPILRRRMRSCVLIACVVLPLCAVGGAAARLDRGATGPRREAAEEGARSPQSKIGRRKGTERVLTTDIARVLAADQPPAGQDRDAAASARRASRPTSTRKRAELERTQAELRFERARLARLRARLSSPAGALRDAAGRALQGRQARPRDRRPQLQGLRRPARARRVHRAASPSRTADHRRSCATPRPTRRRPPTRLDKLERRQQRVTAIVLARRNEIAEVKQELIDTRVGYDNTRAGKQHALDKVRVRAPAARGHLDVDRGRAGRSRPRSARRPAGRSAGPIRGGSGADLAGQRPDHRRLLRAAPGPHAPRHRHRRRRRARRSAPPTAAASRSPGWHRRLRQLHLHPAQRRRCPRATATSRASASASGAGQQGPGHRLRRQHRPLDRPAPALRGAHQRRRPSTR